MASVRPSWSFIAKERFTFDPKAISYVPSQRAGCAVNGLILPLCFLHMDKTPTGPSCLYFLPSLPLIAQAPTFLQICTYFYAVRNGNALSGSFPALP